MILMTVGENKDTETPSKFDRFVFSCGFFWHKNIANVEGKCKQKLCSDQALF